MPGCRLPTRALAACLLLTAAAATPAFDLQGHRGARGLAPENTLAGFRRALAEGVSTLELDVGVTQDGVVVIHHDDALNPDLARTPDGAWISAPILLSDLSLAQLRRFDVGRVRPDSAYAGRLPRQVPGDGETVPTLAELFAMVTASGNRNLRFNIETKISPLRPERTVGPDAMVMAILGVAAAHAMTGRIALQSFDWRTLAASKRLAPGVPTVHLTARQSWLDNLDTRWTAGLRLADHGSIPRMVKAAGGSAWSPYHLDLAAADVAEARALGIAVIPWTVNRRAEIERVLDFKVDGLITDYPDLARELIGARGLAIRPLGRVLGGGNAVR